jgi:hypothetical protein
MYVLTNMLLYFCPDDEYIMLLRNVLHPPIRLHDVITQNIADIISEYSTEPSGS